MRDRGTRLVGYDLHPTPRPRLVLNDDDFQDGGPFKHIFHIFQKIFRSAEKSPEAQTRFLDERTGKVEELFSILCHLLNYGQP